MFRYELDSHFRGNDIRMNFDFNALCIPSGKAGILLKP